MCRCAGFFCGSLVVIILFLAGCGGQSLTPEQATTATARAAFATFDALPADVKAETQTAVMQRINEGLFPTPTP